jgi:iron complex outermembrane receptor protein
VRTNTKSKFDWEAVASLYHYADNELRNPTAALPDAGMGGAGTITRMDGTGWATLDFKGMWRPYGYQGPHQVSFGAHYDQYKLKNPRYTTSNWIAGGPETLSGDSRGRTETRALWAQDVWSFAPRLKATLGARYERWRAYDGFNFSLVAPPAVTLSMLQPERSSSNLSPKASLSWAATDAMLLTASLAKAYRFPTVSELYQTVTVGANPRSPNPDLRPERAYSAELSAEYAVARGRVRLSVFQEEIRDALISQTTPFEGETTLVSTVQNVDRVRSQGFEVVAQGNDVLIRGLELSGSVTFVDSRIVADAALPAAVGKHTPQVPDWRATVVATYRPDERTAMTLAGRYSRRVWGTPDNTDVFPHTFQGFEGYFVIDARVRYRIAKQWSASLGVDNLNNRKYFLFHPFPQRTVVAEARFDY